MKNVNLKNPNSIDYVQLEFGFFLFFVCIVQAFSFQNHRGYFFRAGLLCFLLFGTFDVVQIVVLFVIGQSFKGRFECLVLS